MKQKLKMRELRANSQYREQEKAKDAEQKNLKDVGDSLQLSSVGEGSC